MGGRAQCLSGAHGELEAIEVEILYAKAERFEEAEARSVEQARDRTCDPLPHRCQQCSRLVAREHGRELRWTSRPQGRRQDSEVDAEDVAVEEQERCEGLVLGRGSDTEIDGERSEEGGDGICVELGRMAHAVE
jgi:hypothetical protein